MQFSKNEFTWRITSRLASFRLAFSLLYSNAIVLCLFFHLISLVFMISICFQKMVTIIEEMPFVAAVNDSRLHKVCSNCFARRTETLMDIIYKVIVI